MNEIPNCITGNIRAESLSEYVISPSEVNLSLGDTLAVFTQTPIRISHSYIGNQWDDQTGPQINFNTKDN